MNRLLAPQWGGAHSAVRTSTGQYHVSFRVLISSRYGVLEWLQVHNAQMRGLKLHADL